MGHPEKRRGPDSNERNGILKRATLTATLIALTIPTVTTASTSSTQQLHKSQTVIRFFTNGHPWMTATRHQTCTTVPWRRTCTIARERLAFHQARADRLHRVIWKSIPYTNDWRTSVRLAQRIYPGTQSWLLYISHREGGWGPFVMNHQGSGAGGWLQFMASTFYAYVDAARADAARRGFVVPDNVWTWTHPLGQALTGAYMRYTGRDACHWCL